MDPASRRTSIGTIRPENSPEYRYTYDRTPASTSPEGSTSPHVLPMIYESCPRYNHSMVSQSAVYSPREPLFRPQNSTNPPVCHGHPFHQPSLHSESTPQTEETSSGIPLVPSPRLGAGFSGPKHNRKWLESNRGDDQKRFTIRSTIPPRSSILPSAHQDTPMTASVPLGFGHLLHPQPPPSQQPAETNLKAAFCSRLHLFVRQQPIAARACGFGDKCRRPIDPLPVIQLLMTDFSPQSKEDRKQLTNEQHIVACHLFAASETRGGNAKQRIRSRSDAEHSFERNELGVVNSHVDSNLSSRYRGKILSGNTYASPFSVDADPDPAHAPPHPCSAADREQNPGTTLMRPPGPSPSPDASGLIPAVFFIFSDLCVRTAGWYQLRFQLVNVQEIVQSGSAPIIDEVWSQPFRVYAAKDFPGMRPTPYLATRLKRLGAVGIKTREKKRESRERKVVQNGSEEDIDPDED